MGLTRIPVRMTITVLLAGNVMLLVAIPALLGVSFARPDVDRHRKSLDAGPDAGLLRVRVLPGTAPGRGDLARTRHALPGGRQRDLLGVDAVSGPPARPVPFGHRIPRFLRVRRRRGGLVGAPRHRLLPQGAVARRRDRRRGRRGRARGGSELPPLWCSGRLRSRDRRWRVHGRGSAPRRDDRRPAHRAGRARRIDLGVAGRRDGDLLRGRRRLRRARRRGHLRRWALAVPAVDDRHHPASPYRSGRRGGHVGSAPPDRGRCSRSRCLRPSPPSGSSRSSPSAGTRS